MADRVADAAGVAPNTPDTPEGRGSSRGHAGRWSDCRGRCGVTVTAARMSGIDAPPFTMRTATILSPGATTAVDTARPEPKAGEVRIRLEGSGVCASSLPVWEGREWFEYPREAGSPGHEGWGIVDATGEG